ncbi:MAG TPA: protein-glutamate O-methyltransferase CheR [Polyangiaceae bacterium]
MTLGARADDVRMAPAEFRLLRDLVNGYSGIYFGDDALPMLERRLKDRVSLLGLKTFGEYYQFLKFSNKSSSELDEAIELLTTNETYFFREDYQLRAFRDEVLPRLAADCASRRRLSVWSAGCSTGEEVYTLGILIVESGLFNGWDVRIYGSDISKRCVATARRGIYGASAFRAVGLDVKRTYFVDKADGAHVVDRVRQICHFGHLNLMDTDRVRVVGRVDAVFCRNVLIYFDPRSRKRVIDMFYERLVPGGFLFLGHSESLLNITTAFELVHLSEDLVYRKPLLPAMIRGGGAL